MKKLIFFYSVLMVLQCPVIFAQWQPDVRLTNDTSASYTSANNAWCIAANGSVVHVVWQDKRDSNWEIYYKRSTDSGLTWGTDVRLTNNSSFSQNPFISVSQTAVNVVWKDDRDGNYEIYYKRDPTGNTIGIKNINSEVPKDYNLFQNYPNPFNPNTQIEYSVPKAGNVSLEVYDMTGKKVATLVNETKAVGNYRYDFNAGGLASGVYIYSLKADGVNLTKKMILVK